MPIYGKRGKKQTIETYIDSLSRGKTAKSRLGFLKKKFLTQAGVISKPQSNFLISIINELVKAGFKLDASGLSRDNRTVTFLKRAGVQALYEFINFLIERGLTVTVTTKEIVEGEEITREIDVTVQSLFMPSEAEEAEKKRAEAEEEKKREDDKERRKEKEKEKKSKKKAEQTKKAQKKVEKKAERAEKTEKKEKEKQKEADEIEKQNKLSEAQILVAEHERSVLNAETERKQIEINEIERQQVIAEQTSQEQPAREPTPPAREPTPPAREPTPPAREPIVKELAEEKQAKKAREAPDKKNEKQVIKNVELVQAPQVPQEQSFEQQVKNDESQEKQLKEQVNQGAEIVAQAEIKNDNDVNEVVMNMPEQVEVVQFDSDDLMMDMFENSENKTAELLQGNPRNEGVLAAPPDPMIKRITLLKEIRDILTNLKRANRPTNQDELLDRYIDLKDEYGEFNTVDETDEIRKKVNFLLRSIRGLLGARTENTFILIQARRKSREVRRARTQLSQAQEKLSKTDKALNMIRSRVLNDGLLKPSPDQVQIEPNEETELIRESFEEIDQDIKENGVNDENLSKFIKIMRIVQQDTYSVVTSAVGNDPSILISPSGFAVGVGGGLLMRVLGRLLYSNTEIQDNEELSTARVEAFYTDGNLQGVNLSVRQRLINGLRGIVPVPPSLSDRESFQDIDLGGELKEESKEEYDRRTLRQRRRTTGLRKRLSDKVSGIFQSLPPTSATDPPTRGFYGFMEDLQSVVRSDLNESRNREKIILFYTSSFLFDEPKTRQEVEDNLLRGLNPSQIQAFAETLEQELVNPERVQLFAESRANVSEVFVEIKRVSSPKTIRERIREWIDKQIQRGKRFKRFRPRNKRRAEVTPNAEALSRRFSGEEGIELEGIELEEREQKEGAELEDIVIEDPALADGGEEFKEQQRTAIEKLRETIVLGARAFLTTGALRSREGLSMMTEKITENIESLAQRAPDVRDYLRSASPSSLDNLISNTVSRLVGLANTAGSVASSITPETLGSLKYTIGGSIAGGVIGVAIGIVLQYALYSAIEYIYSGEEQQQDETIYQERKLERGKTTEFNKGEEKPVSPEDIDKPQGEPLLRPEFNMTGIDFFNKAFNITPLDAQNSEWAEFDYAKKIDIQNLIEIDNELNDKIRFSGDMFYPEYIEPPKPPSNDAVILGRTGMIDQIQLTQQFAPKFDGAVTIFDNLSNTRNHDAFSRSWQDNILYNQDRM